MGFEYKTDLLRGRDTSAEGKVTDQTKEGTLDAWKKNIKTSLSKETTEQLTAHRDQATDENSPWYGSLYKEVIDAIDEILAERAKSRKIE
jgi:hypothetical protein